MVRLNFLIIVLAILASSVMAQTVTVDAAEGSPNNTDTFNSIQMAIHSFQASGAVTDSTDGSGVGVNHGDAAADVINVLTSAVPDEYVCVDAIGGGSDDDIVLDEDLTIQGSGGQAVVALQQYASAGYSYFTDCGFSWRQTVDLTLKDLVLIPSETNTPADDAIYFRAPGDDSDVVVNLDNVVVTANMGSNTPATLTGLDNPDISGATGYGDDGIYNVSESDNGSITVNAANLVISSFSTDPEGNHDCIINFLSGSAVDLINANFYLGEGCVLSNAPRFGVQNPYGGYVAIQGSDVSPVIIKNVGADGVWNYSYPDPNQPSVTTCDYGIICGCGGSGLKEQETDGDGFVQSVTNSIIANTVGPGIAFFADSTLPTGFTGPVEISNVTVHNCGYADANDPPWSYGIAAPVYDDTYKSNRDVNITDTIVTGYGLTGLYNDGDGTWTVDYTALCTTNYPDHYYGLATATDGSGTINLGSNVINDSPIYVAYEMTDCGTEDYLDVDNPNFAGKGSGGSDLAGGADFIGSWEPPQATGNQWIMYK